MLISSLLSDPHTPLVLLPSWLVTGLALLSPPWVLLLALFVFPISLLLLKWFITFFPFVSLQLTILAQLSRSTDVSGTRTPAEPLCHACQLGRHVWLLFSSSSHATHAFDLVHCDLWTSHVLSLSGYKYYLVVVDDFSHYSWTFSLRAKSETFPTLLHFFAWVSTQFGLTVKAVQCDNRREFGNFTSRSFFLSGCSAVYVLSVYLYSKR